MTSSSNAGDTPTEPGDDAITTDDSWQLVDRVRKLMAKAEASNNPHESDAFARKAAELVMRHRIDLSRLDGTGSGDELGIRSLVLGRGAYVRARLALLTAVAEVHDARVVFGSSPQGTIAYVAGPTGELEVIEVMYHSLHTQMAAQVVRERRATPAATQRHRRSFMFGYADRIGGLLAETRHAVEEQPTAEGGNGHLPARLERLERVDAFVEQSLGRIRSARSVAGADVGSWSAGSAAAGAADVGRARLAGRRALGSG